MNNNNNRLNEKLLDVLSTIENIYLKEGEQFRSRAFKNAFDSLASYNDSIINYEQLKELELKGFGKSVLAVCKEYIDNNGSVKIIEEAKNNPIHIFENIYGVGPQHAKKLVENGITTMELLRKNADKVLNKKQQLGLKYYDDINSRIPREIIDKYNKTFKALLPTTNDGGKILMEFVGSYRRGLLHSGDIDVIFSYYPENIEDIDGDEYEIIMKRNSALFQEFINNLINNGIILPEHILASGNSKCLVLAKIPEDTKYRRIDFLSCNFNEYATSLLYFTGSKYFNTVMRQWAVDKGYTMNEHRISLLSDKGDKEEKYNKDKLIFYDEQDIFDFLGLLYKAPIDRKDGRDVIPIETIVEYIRKNGLSNVDLITKKYLYRSAKYAYYNKPDPIMTDKEFDELEENIASSDVNFSIPIGIEPNKNKVKLPYIAPSLNKIKPDTNLLNKWTTKYTGPYVLSCKLDGCSVIIYKKNNLLYMNTRGDGLYGQDVSFLLPHMKNLGTLNENDCIRGELIMRKDVFERKYNGIYSNIRNMVAGILAEKKKINVELINDLDVILYEVMYPELKPSDQLVYLNQMRWPIVWHNLTTKISNELLSNLFATMRIDYIYDIDGIVCVNDKIYIRGDDYQKNPPNAFAFKMDLEDQIEEVFVTGVSWHPSKDGYLKPVIHYDTVFIKGVNCTNATAYNAAFIRDNKIGIGAKIKVIRSNDVIPKVIEVIEPANIINYPNPNEVGEYYWNETNIDLVLNNPDNNEDVLVQTILRFFKMIEAPNLGEGNIIKLIKSGKNTIELILSMTLDDWMTIKGFGEKMAKKLYEGVQTAMNKVSLIKLMAASNIFGRGFSDKKLAIIIENYPTIFADIYDSSDEDIIIRLMDIQGIGPKTAEGFKENLKEFIEFIERIGQMDKLNLNNKMKNTFDSSNIKVVFSGFRDKELKEKILSKGIKIEENLNKNINYLIVKDKSDVTSKVEKAIQYNIPILSIEEFINMIL